MPDCDPPQFFSASCILLNAIDRQLFENRLLKTVCQGVKEELAIEKSEWRSIKRIHGDVPCKVMNFEAA